MRAHIKGFLEFVQKQGIFSLAIGFILGGAVSKVVTALVTDIVNPLLGIILGRAEGLKTAKFTLLGSDILWGDFVSVIIDFLVIAVIVYFAVRWLKLDKEAEDKKAKKH